MSTDQFNGGMSSRQNMLISVILSTYNQPAWLEKVLWGYSCQTDQLFEIVIADDGSEEATHEVIRKIKDQTSLSIKHVWQKHHSHPTGFLVKGLKMGWC